MVSLLVGACVAAEQDGFPEVCFAPAIAASIAAIAARVDGLIWLGLHGPSLVALTAQTASRAPACLAA